MPHLRHIASFLVLTIFLSGCIGVPDQQPTERPAQIATVDFVDGIVVPVFQLMSMLSAFYAENHTVPADQEALAVFASKIREPVKWNQFSRFEMSNESGHPVLYLGVTSPSSLSESGEINTSWRISLNEPALAGRDPTFSVSPASSFCLVPSPGAPPREYTKLEMFLGFLTAHPFGPSSEKPLCFAGSTQKTDKVREKLDRLRRKQLQQRSTAS